MKKFKTKAELKSLSQDYEPSKSVAGRGSFWSLFPLDPEAIIMEN